ncbi:unnamed protein product [Prunus armeniaca]|uniref:Uncharacterized protein n=1 Tax=Prunus armeniaca TaxID=36596 RepID=A0A6J5TNK4_PRUAR|nr:unnamed protein product [Prunus armeniaca]
MEVEDFEVHHEKDSLDFYVLLLTPHLLGSYEPSSPARFLVKFDYQVNHIYYDIRSSDDIGTRRETLVDQFQEKDEKTIEFEKPVLRKCGESYEFLSQVLSSFGITSSDENAGLHDQILDGIIKWGRKIRQEFFSDERPEVWGLYVHIGKDHAMYRCEECLKGKVRRKSMAASNYKGMVSIKRVLKKVIDGKLGSCVDVKEEGTKRKGRRITGSDNVKEEGRERKTRGISVVDDVEEEEGTTNRKRRRSVVSDNVKEEGTKRKSRRSSGSESESCSVCMEMTKKKSRLVVPWFL